MVDVCVHLGWQMVGFFMYLYWSVVQRNTRLAPSHLFCFSLLDAVMQEPVLVQMDNDVTVLNKPAATGYYQHLPPHSHEHESMGGHKDYDF